MTVDTFTDVESLGLPVDPDGLLTFDWNDNDGEITSIELDSWEGLSGTAPIGSDLTLVATEDATGEILTTFSIPVSLDGTWSLTQDDVESALRRHLFIAVVGVCERPDLPIFGKHEVFYQNTRPVDQLILHTRNRIIYLVFMKVVLLKSYGMSSSNFLRQAPVENDWMIASAPVASTIEILEFCVGFDLLELACCRSLQYAETVGTVTAGKLYDIRIDGQSIVTPDGVNDYYPFVEQIMRGSVTTGTIIGLSADDYSSGTSTTFIYNVDGEKIGATGVPTMSEMEALFFEEETGALVTTSLERLISMQH